MIGHALRLLERLEQATAQLFAQAPGEVIAIRGDAGERLDLQNRMAGGDALGLQPLISQAITPGRYAQPHRVLLAVAGVMRRQLAPQAPHLHPHHRIIAGAVHRRIATEHRDADGVFGKGGI
ncbi:hypothetical protein D3C73_1017150 [compost metagenome]